MKALVAMVIILVLWPSQTTPQISAHIDVQPQPTGLLGFYDTIFPLGFKVTITNSQESPLPAGNLTIHVDAPSGKYASWYTIPFQEIAPHASASVQETLQPVEAGVYTFHVDYYDSPAGRIELGGTPLTVVALLGPEIVYGSIAGLAVAIMAVLVAVKRRG